LKGLSKILLDIDKAIRIIRETESEDEVIPNLMIGFGIDADQAEFIAEIRLRNINREYILKRVNETDALEKEIAELDELVGSKKKLFDIIVKELEETAKKYGEPRRTGIVSEAETESDGEEPEPEDYPVTVFLSREGYLKKITPLSLRMSGEQKYKENDGPLSSAETTNNAEAIFFTDRCHAYKCRLRDFEDGKASLLGDYLPAKLGMEDGETVVYLCLPGDYVGDMLFFFENGKVARVSVSAYDTKSNRRCLTGAYSDKSPLVRIEFIRQDCEFVMASSDTRTLVFSSSLLAPKTTRTTLGIGVMTLKKGQRLSNVKKLEESGLQNDKRYRVRSLPAPGALLRPEDIGEQQLDIGL
jgi:DNA gyrase subunit A